MGSWMVRGISLSSLEGRHTEGLVWVIYVFAAIAHAQKVSWLNTTDLKYIAVVFN